MSRIFKKTAFYFILLLFFVFSAQTGLANEQNMDATPNSKNRVKTIIVDNYFPYTFVNQDGLPDGFSVDLSKAVTRVMGMKLAFKVDTWEKARAALEDGKIDFLPMMAYSKERDIFFDFTVPHTIAYDAFFSRVDSVKINDLDDLAGKKIIVMKNDQAHDYLKSTLNIKPDNLILIDSLPDALRLLSSGKGDAALMPKLVGLIVIRQLGLANLSESPTVTEDYNRPFSLSVKQGNQPLLERLGQGLSIVKNSGEYGQIYEKWFGAIDPKGVAFRDIIIYVASGIGALTIIAFILAFWFISLKKQVAFRTQELEQEIIVRKEAEEATRESEEYFRGFAEQSLVGIYLFQDGVFKYINPKFAEIFGYTVEECLNNMVFKDLVHTNYLATVEENVRQRKSGDIKPNHYNVKCIRKDGDIIWVEIFGSAILLKGRPVAIGTMLDVTDRKRTEEKYKRLIRNALVGVYQVTEEGKFIFVNQKTAEMFGYESPEELYSELDSIVHLYAYPEERTDILREINEIGYVAGREVKFVNKDGADIWLKLFTTSFKDRQNVIFEGLMQEITEQKQLETQLRHAEKMEAVGTLSGGIAHDFNNILAAIMGNAELALDDALAGKTTLKEIQQILKAAGRAKGLVQQILSFSRTAETHLRPLDINKAIIEATSVIERTIPKMIDLELHLDQDLEYISGDSNQIEQILLNLASNAEDAMPDGGKLIIETQDTNLDEQYGNSHPGGLSGDYVLLTVSDTGEGMDEDTLEHIFEPFYTTKGVGKGTGLGLSSVYGIVKSHNGYVMCYSEPGVGTTFKIFLPILKSDEKPGEAEEVDVDLIPGGIETILLVDDEESWRDVGSRTLESKGYQVVTASNGEEALDIYRAIGNQINLVILDLSMPGMGGHEALKKILAINPEARVLISSGYSAKGQVKDTLKSGAVGYITKPFRKAELFKTVREVLDS
jgi:PAS domain S-box-containing protein